MRQDLDAVGVELLIGDGFGRSIENRRNMILRLDVGRYRGRVGYGDTVLDISLKDLRARR